MAMSRQYPRDDLTQAYESRCENWSWAIRLAKLALLTLLIGKLYIAVLLMFGIAFIEHYVLAPFGYRPLTDFLVDRIVTTPHQGLAPDG